ncbi:hypothetical protein PHYPSEUDO_013152 [Phytophthora pseudosyringae]|uniref:Uncharacterized protein n=1 Tax=Phytophthora pseudosyringae TaxID=221518 RepID=A0A8T1V698_9STRA|nr:hypothetical protein PHYPSEUDO_013152 [Phytophthora pseudosyringae]
MHSQQMIKHVTGGKLNKKVSKPDVAKEMASMLSPKCHDRQFQQGARQWKVFFDERLWDVAGRPFGRHSKEEACWITVEASQYQGACQGVGFLEQPTRADVEDPPLQNEDNSTEVEQIRLRTLFNTVHTVEAMTAEWVIVKRDGIATLGLETLALPNIRQSQRGL